MLAAGGVGEAEPAGMQRLAREIGDPRTQRTRAGDGAAGAGAIDRIADQRMTALGEMNADLMGAAGRRGGTRSAPPSAAKTRATR